MSDNSKKNIAIIVPTLSHSVEYNFSLGIKRVLPENEFNLITLSVGWIEPGTEALGLASRLHEMLNFNALHGIIIYGAGVTNRVHPDAILNVTACYPNIPIINVGNIVETLPSVVVDNTSPFRRFVQHLVENKKLTEIAFLGGPKDNYDAQKRRQAFREAMQEYSLPLPESLDWDGDFRVAGGSFALRKYLSKYQKPPQAIICANDLSAIGVINESLNCGYGIPEDIHIIGFDDLEYAIKVAVPISTGRYPISAMGEKSGRLLLEWFGGKNPALVTEVKGSVVYRASTGDVGSEKSQLESALSQDRYYFSRDSNSERLHISRGVNNSENLKAAFLKIATHVYNTGVRVLYFFRANEEGNKIESILEIAEERVRTLPLDHPFHQIIDLDYLFSERSSENLRWVVSPVVTDGNFYGYILTSLIAGEEDFCEYIANEICKKIENMRLSRNFNELRHQVLKAEQMASLGRLVSGVAHEINTPLGISLLAATHLNDELKTVKTNVADGKLTQSVFNEFLSTCDETYQILHGSLQRAVNLVASFKQISVDRQVEETRLLQLDEYLDEILLSISPKLKGTLVTLEVDFETGIQLTTQPNAWAQILTNLILNALHHAFDQGRIRGVISLKLFERNREINLIVSDNGAGIEKDKLPLIFDPFFTTARGKGGTGLGLNIVYNLVTQQLLGQINVTSVVRDSNHENSGTSFSICIPRP